MVQPLLVKPRAGRHYHDRAHPPVRSASAIVAAVITWKYILPCGSADSIAWLPSRPAAFQGENNASA